MRLRPLVHFGLPLAFFVGCTIREVPPSNNPGTAAATPPPATATPAETTTVAPPVATVAPTATPTTGTPTTGMINPTTAKAVAAMTKPNSFGQPKPFTGALEGLVYDIPASTTQLPQSFAGMTPFTSLWSQSWNIADRDFNEGFPGIEKNRVEWFAIHWDGTIQATKAGVFDFRLVSDDGARIYIDNVLVVNNDGLHAVKTATGSTTLNAGPHHVVIDYFQGPKWRIALQIFVKGTNMPEKPLTSSF
jgi:hypothetical protein